MTMASPTVTISILNYQRRDLLRQVVARAIAQDYPDIEVIVVDNASTDGSDRMVEEEFPQVRLIRLPENVGCAARNAGLAAAKGEIVITIDNDVLLESPRAARGAVDVFARYPNAACVNFMILGPDGQLSRRDWCHPRDWRRFAREEFLTDYVLEGASAFRRDAFDRAGGYWPALFIGHEGRDLAFRLINAGYDLVYAPSVAVHHVTSPEARPSSRIFYTFTRNAVWVALRNHRAGAAARAIVHAFVLMAFSSVRAGHVTSFLAGLRDAVAGAPAAWAARQPLTATAYERLREIGRLRPTLFERAMRHWRERPI